MDLSVNSEQVQKDSVNDTSVIAIHKLYHDDGNSFFIAKTISSDDSNQEQSGVTINFL